MITREYDALNRVTEYTDCRGNTVRYGYDEIGNLISLTYPGGEIVRYTYYKNGWLETVTDERGNTTRYSYDARGNLTHTERPNGTEEFCTYDAAGRLISRQDICGEEVLTEYTYTYDESGNITAVGGTKTTDTGEGISRLGSAEMTYDAENRLVSAGGIRYTYDAENNRTAMETAEYREEYVTDTVSSSLSRVLTVTVIPKTAEGTDGDKEAEGIMTLCVYGNGLLYEYTGDLYLYHHYNHLGSTTKLTDGRGRVEASFTYGAYGELLSGDASLTRFLYNGQCGVSTDDNGLYYMRQRYYNPEIKRFVNQDILSGSVADSQSLNRYSYVQGNPVSYTDPFGLSPLGGLFTGTALVHGVLGVLGCLPGMAGAVFNGIDAWVYAAIDKDYYMAAMSGFSALSLGIGSIAKWAKKAAVLSKGTRAGKFYHYLAVTGSYLSNGIEFAQNGYQMAIAGYDLWDAYMKNGKSLGREDLGKVAALGLSAMATVMSGMNFSKSSKELAKALEEDGITSAFRKRAVQFGDGGKSSSDVIVEVELSRSRYPESAKHIQDAIADGKPDVLTIDRAGAKERRKASLKGVDTIPGLDRDEYPPAMSLEGGKGASVRHIGQPDNRGSGSSLSHQLREYPDGTKYRITIIEGDE